MTDTPKPKVSRGAKFPIVWIVPIIAALVAGWMIYRQWSELGPLVRIEFADGSGIKAGQTTLSYKGVEVGIVEEVELKKDLSGIIVSLQLQKSAKSLAREGTQFWVVKPKIGFSGVSDLNTLVSGVYLNAHPGEGDFKRHFIGLDEAPAPVGKEKGAAYTLYTRNLGAVSLQSPIYYRQVTVGEVEDIRLSENASGVEIRIRIYTPYISLIRENTRFWNASGAPFSFSLFGGGSDKTSLESIVSGAIGFATPTKYGDPAVEGYEFKLYDEGDNDWLDWKPDLQLYQSHGEESGEDGSDA